MITEYVTSVRRRVFLVTQKYRLLRQRIVKTSIYLQFVDSDGEWWDSAELTPHPPTVTCNAQHFISSFIPIILSSSSQKWLDMLNLYSLDSICSLKTKRTALRSVIQDHPSSMLICNLRTRIKDTCSLVVRVHTCCKLVNSGRTQRTFHEVH